MNLIQEIKVLSLPLLQKLFSQPIMFSQLCMRKGVKNIRQNLSKLYQNRIIMHARFANPHLIICGKLFSMMNSLQKQQTKPSGERERKKKGIVRDEWASLIAFLAIDKGICSMLAVIKYELAANGAL